MNSKPQQKNKKSKTTKRRFSENGITSKSGLQFGNQKEKKKTKDALWR
jgi:hypothetical protein